MIYIKNNTEVQTLYIPRQDELAQSGSIKDLYYQSGYTDGFNSGMTEGFAEGYESGETHQKGLLSAETFTDNGLYERENGISAITVDVDLDAPYESGYTDGYESGYTSGYSSGYTSGETAGYDSGYSEGYESGYSSGSDVGYASGYSSGYTSGETDGYGSGYTSGVTDGFESGFTSGYSEGYDSGFTSGETVGYESGVTDGYSSGYTSGETDGFNSGYTSGVTDGEQNIIGTFSSTTAYTNGVYGTSANPLSSITVDVSGQSCSLSAGTFTENGTYEPVVTFLDYIETDGYDILFDTGVKMTSTGETVVLDFMPLTGTIHYDAYLCYMSQQQNDSSDTWQLGFRQATIFANNPSGGYWYTNGGVTNMSVIGLISADTRAYVEISNTGITINGISSAFNITTVVNTDCNIVLNGQFASNANYRCPYARYYGFKLIDDDGVTALADLRPALDGNTPCFYDMVSGNFIHQIGTGRTTAGNVIGTSAVFDGWSSVTVNVDTAATYASGVTDGENAIIATFTADTATTNGIYGSSAHPLSSLTVDVDQSGSYQSGWTSGYSAGFRDGQIDRYETYTATTATTNGVYGSSAHPLSSITVAVPTGSSVSNQYGSNSIWATYDFATSGSKKILANTYYTTGMYIDGSSTSASTTTAYTFSTAGKHTIEFIGNNPQSDGKYMFYFGGTDVVELVIGEQFGMTSTSNGGSISGCTSLSSITITNRDSVMNCSSQEMLRTLPNNGVLYVPSNLLTAYSSTYWKTVLVDEKGWNMTAINDDSIIAHEEGYDDGKDIQSAKIEWNAQTLNVSANGSYSTSLQSQGYLWKEVIVDVPQSGGSGSCTGSSEPVLTAWGVEYDTGIALGWGYSLSASHVTLRPDLSSNNYEYLFGDYNSSFGYYGLFRWGNDVIFKNTHMLSVKGLLYDSSFYISTAGTVINGETVDSGDHILPTENSIKLFSDSSGNYITTSGQTLGVVEIWDENQNLVGRFTPQPDGTFYDDVNDTTIYPTVLDQNNYGYSFEYYDSQYREGCKDGWDIGFDDGWGRGYDWGYSSGHTDGYQSGMNDGIGIGYQSGWVEGYQSGYTQGYDDGSQGGGGSQDYMGMIQRTLSGSVVLPDGITTIGRYAFGYCTGITSIVIPDTVSLLENRSFADCSMTAVTIGSGVTTIRDYAFSNDNALKTLYFRSSTPPSLGNRAFPYNASYAGSGNMYVPSGSSATYQSFKTNAGNQYFSGWTIHEYEVQ